MRGYWYKKLHVGSHTYVIRDDKPPTYIFSHLINASKFTMPPIVHSINGNYATYELKFDVLNCIIDAIEATRLLE